jgi:hypothetical protein
MSQNMGQSIVVENQPGAAAIGAERPRPLRTATIGASTTAS